MAAQVVPFLFETKSPIRTFTDEHGSPWFCATDVCAVLGYVNAPDAIAKHCRQKGIAKRDTLTEKGFQSLTYINEGNLYRLIVKSRKPEAEKFENWIYDEVIPSIQKSGSYSIGSMAALSSHTVRATQIGNSKSVNHLHVAVGGAAAAIQYNVKNCTIQSGRAPFEWKKIAKQEGLPSKHRNSAKDVLRVKAPQVACGMSLADQLVSGGATQEDGISIGKDSQFIFQRILALGITPPELLL
jgi:prophage antirepressor-like protein